MPRPLHVVSGASESVGGFGSPPRSTYRHFRWRGGVHRRCAVAMDGDGISSTTLGVSCRELRGPGAIWNVLQWTSVVTSVTRLGIVGWGPWCRSTGELFIMEIVRWDDDPGLSIPPAGCRGRREYDYCPTCGNSIVPTGFLTSSLSWYYCLYCSWLVATDEPWVKHLRYVLFSDRKFRQATRLRKCTSDKLVSDQYDDRIRTYKLALRWYTSIKLVCLQLAVLNIYQRKPSLCVRTESIRSSY